MNVPESQAIKGFISMANGGWLQGWHERNGGNLSYRMTDKDVKDISENLSECGEWREIGASVPKLANEYFVVTGSGKFFRRNGCRNTYKGNVGNRRSKAADY